MSFSDDRPLTAVEKREFALARLPDAVRREAEAEAAFAAEARGSQSAGERWRELSAARRALAEVNEMLEGPPALSPHAPRQFRDDLHEAWAAAPLSPFARLGQELQQMSVPHYPTRGPWADALSEEEQAELDFVVRNLGKCAAAELELGSGMSPEQLLELAGTGPKAPSGTPGYVVVDGVLLGRIARGLPRAMALAEGTSRRHFDPAAAAARRRGWNPGGQR